MGAAPSVLVVDPVPEGAGALEGRGCGASAVAVGAAGELRAVDTCGRGGLVVPGVGLARALVVRGGARVEDAPAQRVSIESQRVRKYERRRRERLIARALHRDRTYWEKDFLLHRLLRMWW